MTVASRGSAGIPSDYQIRGVTPDSTQTFFPLNLDQYYTNTGGNSG